MSLMPTTLAVRESRAVPLQTGDPMEDCGQCRPCEDPGCRVVLSRYNPAPRCTLHKGWADASPIRRGTR